MTLERAIEILEEHNKYRNGESWRTSYAFNEVTEAIDTVVKHFKNEKSQVQRS